MTTKKLTSQDLDEQAWFAYCAKMNALYDAKEDELVAAGWCKHGRGRNRYYTQPAAQPLVIRRQFGSPTWYTCPKDF